MKEFNTYVILFITIMLVGCGNVGNSAGDGTSSNQSTALNGILKTYLQKNGRAQTFSAISATVQCNNQAPINAAVGTFQLTNSLPINTNSLFQMGSISKSYTSVVLLQLADDPHYNFDIHDTMGKWFPEYPQWADITIEELMNMSGGIPDYANGLRNANGDINIFAINSIKNPTFYFAPESIVAAMADKPVDFAPGTSYSYSNTNYILLGMLIQRITNHSPKIEIQNRIFNKLNLTHTYFPLNLPESDVPMMDMAHGYVLIQDAPSPFDNMNGLYDVTLNSMSLYYTAGGIISTPSDLNTYVHALFNPGILLTPGQIKTLTTNMVGMIQPYLGQPISQVSKSVPLGYGLGIINKYIAAPINSSVYIYPAGTLGYLGVYVYVPSHNLSIAFAINGATNYSSTELENELFRYALRICGVN